MKKQSFSIIIGILVVVLGVVYGGNVIGFWDLEISFDGCWTLFIIVPCAFSIFTGGLNFVNAVGLALGVLFLLSEQNILQNDLGYKLTAPIIVVAIGLGLVFRRSGRRKAEGTNGIYAGVNGENYFAIFGGNSPRFKGEVFQGANVYAIFGGVDLHLRDAIIKRDCVINVYSIFGGTDIFLPDNVRVQISSIPIFGGVDNAFESSKNDVSPTVYIRALSVFGATDIK